MARNRLSLIGMLRGSEPGGGREEEGGGRVFIELRICQLFGH